MQVQTCTCHVCTRNAQEAERQGSWGFSLYLGTEFALRLLRELALRILREFALRLSRAISVAFAKGR